MDEALEAAIDDAGREKVFDLLRSNGWAGGTPPTWVWWMAAEQARQMPDRPRRQRMIVHHWHEAQPPSLFRGIFGFDL